MSSPLAPAAGAGSLRRALRPRRRSGVVATDSLDGRVLRSRNGDSAFALNASGGAIWDLCDGERTLFEIADALRSQFDCDDIELLVDLTAALAQLRECGLIEASGDSAGSSVKFVMGVEDTPYFHWQLPILFESLHGQLPPGWEFLVVVCNDHQPVSEILRERLACYSVRHFTGADHPANRDMDFAGGGDCYRPLNRIEALSVVADHVAPHHLILLMDSDNFLYRDLDLAIFPQRDAVCANWLVAKERFFADSRKGSPGIVSLQGLLRSIGCESTFAPGGVSVFLTGATVRNRKFVQDCFRFTQVVYLLGKIGGSPDVWVSEMPAFALSLTANGLPYEVVDPDNRQFVIDKREAVEPGAFYHYYSDRADGRVDGAFRNSRWCKQDFLDSDFLAADIDGHAADAVTDHEHFFFQLARRARQRLRHQKRGRS